MSRIIYSNGHYLPYATHSIHPEDRGYQFGDGVYEVFAVYDGKIFEASPHLKRLHRSLGEIRLTLPPSFSDATLLHLMEETRHRNRCRHGMIYLQITRGTAARAHEFSHQTEMRPNLTIIARPISPEAMSRKSERGIRVKTLPDIRWGRCDIKSLNLLANSLMRDEAHQEGFNEAWMVRDGVITEGASSNAWIVADGALITHPADTHILDGITRQTIINLARQSNVRVEERPFSSEEALNAEEAFSSASVMGIAPVLEIDGKKLADGKAGAITNLMRKALRDYIRKEKA